MYFKNLGLTLVVFFAFSVIESHQAEVLSLVKKQLLKMHGRCANFTGVDEALIDAARQEFMSAEKINLPNDESFKCFLHCMFDRFGLVDSQNIVHLESIIEVLPVELHDKILNLANACGGTTASNGCDAVFNFVNCCFENDLPFLRTTINGLLG